MSDFSTTLRAFIQRAARTPGQLATLSGIPKTTIESWLSGIVKRPRQWLPLVQVAKQLHLKRAELDALLTSAGHPDFAQLYETSLFNGDEEEIRWLGSWEMPATHSPILSAPFQAPPRLPHFIGRTTQLNTLLNNLQYNAPHPIYCIQGMAGVGKTALATELAYLLRPHFPDGILWARLDLSEPMALLMGFAQALGHDVSDYNDLHSRSQLVRGSLVEKQSLIVLDYVDDNKTAELFCPPTGSCAVLLTTRHRNLPLAQGGFCLDLPPFDEEESRQLFENLLDKAVVDKESKALEDIADSVGHLPLAVHISASRLRYEPNWLPAHFLARLQDQERRLQMLSQEAKGVLPAINSSFECLPPKQQQFFSALGVFGTVPFSPELAGIVAGCTLSDAEDGLRTLYLLSLVGLANAGNYVLHPLIADFAQSQLQTDQPKQRFIAHFLGFAQDNATNYSQLFDQLSHLRNLLQLSAGIGSPHQTTLINLLAPFLLAGGYYTLAQTHLQKALPNSPTPHSPTPDSPLPIPIAYATYYLGQLAERNGEFTLAQSLYEQLLERLPTLQSDQRLISMIFQGSAWVAFQQGDYDRVQTNLAQAKIYLRKGVVRLTRRELMERQVSIAQNELSAAIRGYELSGVQTGGLALTAKRGDKQTASQLWQGAEKQLYDGLTLARTIGFADGVGSGLLVALGWIALFQGKIEQAKAYFDEGLKVATTIQHRERISHLNLGLGLTALQRESFQEAKGYLEQSEETAGQIRHNMLQVASLLAQGWVAIYQNDLAVAEKAWKRCLAQMPAGEPHPLLSLLDVGLEILRQGEDSSQITADFSELEPLIWDILQTLSLTTFSQTIWH